MTAEATARAAALMPLLHFTPADLDANRAGQLSAAQRQRLRAMQARSLMIGGGGLVGLAFVATLLIFLGQQNQSVILSFAGVLLTLCNALFVGMVARHWLRLSADLRAGTVEVVSGTLERILQPNRRGSNYVVRVAGRRFSVTKEQFKGFEHEAPYRLYLAAHAAILFSAEPV